MTLLKFRQAPATFYQIQFLNAAEPLDAILELRRVGTITHCLREHDLERPFPAQVFRTTRT